MVVVAALRGRSGRLVAEEGRADWSDVVVAGLEAGRRGSWLRGRPSKGLLWRPSVEGETKMEARRRRGYRWGCWPKKGEGRWGVWLDEEKKTEERVDVRLTGENKAVKDSESGRESEGK